jgi:hypothetical protein
LFDAFPSDPTPNDALHFQRLLADEILRTEAEQHLERSQLRKEHVRLVRIYGDALAWSLLSRYAIRQLARNTGKPPHLTGQGRAFDLVMDCASELAAQGMASLVADLTNVLRNGDLIACDDDDAPTIFECKLKGVDPKFARQGRRGRQLSRLESIGEFLRCGRGCIFGVKDDLRTVQISHVPHFSYEIVDQITASALEHRPVAVALSSHEFYAAGMAGESAEFSSVLRQITHKPGRQIAIGSSLDPLCQGVWDALPPILWPIDRASRWALMEGDVAITHGMCPDVFVGLERGHVRTVAVADAPGQVPCTYKILVGDKEVTIGGTVVLDVLYRHYTVQSAGDLLLETAEVSVASFVGSP